MSSLPKNILFACTISTLVLSMWQVHKLTYEQTHRNRYLMPEKSGSAISKLNTCTNSLLGEIRRCHMRHQMMMTSYVVWKNHWDLNQTLTGHQFLILIFPIDSRKDEFRHKHATTEQSEEDGMHIAGKAPEGCVTPPGWGFETFKWRTTQHGRWKICAICNFYQKSVLFARV